jgi:hypothetical protein
MKNRTGLKDYVPRSIEVSDNSIAALGKEIPAVINDNELSVSKEKENENSTKVERFIKYLKVMRQMKLSYNEDDYMKDKDYRDAVISNVDGENYMKKCVDHKDLDEEQIKERIKKQVEMEEEQEKNANVNANVITNSITAIAKEVPPVINDNELSVTEEPEGDNQTEYYRMLKYIMIIRYYGLDFNINKFVNDGSYGEEKIKEESFKEHLKKFDEENVEIEGHEFIGTRLKIKFKGELSRKGNDDNVDIKNSITTTAEEIPVVVNDNELKVTESKLR